MFLATPQCAGLGLADSPLATETSVTHRVENPWSTIPGRGIEDGPQVEEEHGHDTATIHVRLGVVLWICDLDVCADDPHTNGTTERTDQKQVTTTNVVDKIQQPHEGDHSLDYAKDTGCEQTVVSLDTNSLREWLVKASFINGRINYLP